MFKTIPLIAGAALLCAGVAQAALPQAQADPEQLAADEASLTCGVSISPQGGPGNERDRSPDENLVANVADQDLRPVARPVYLDGGYFGGDDGGDN